MAQRRARYVRAPHPSPKPSRPGSSTYRHKTLQSSVTPLFRFLLISESVSSTFQTDDEWFGFKAPPPPLCPSKSPHFWPGSVSTPVSLSPIICPLFHSQSDLGKMYYFIGSCLPLVHWLPLTLRIQIHSPPLTGSSLLASPYSLLPSLYHCGLLADLPTCQLPLWPLLLLFPSPGSSSHGWSPGSLLTARKSLFKWHLIGMPPIRNSTSLAPLFLFLPVILSDTQFICLISVSSN